MWYRRSAREELIERILDELPRSVRKKEGVKEYARDYVSTLKLEDIKLGNERLVRSGIEYVTKEISKSDTS